MIKFNPRTGTLRDPYPNFSLSSFLVKYCFAEKGMIKYYTDQVQAIQKAKELGNVEIKPVQNRYVLTLILPI